jgi:hypothetical protein
MAESNFEFIYKDAYGYQLRATIQEYDEATELWVPSDISIFTTKQFKIEKPDGASVTLTALFETDGTDGILFYLQLGSSDLFNQAGWYRMQAILSSGTQYFPTSEVGFKVNKPI